MRTRARYLRARLIIIIFIFIPSFLLPDFSFSCAPLRGSSVLQAKEGWRVARRGLFPICARGRVPADADESGNGHRTPGEQRGPGPLPTKNAMPSKMQENLQKIGEKALSRLHYGL